jgi:hypothetical protein
MLLHQASRIPVKLLDITSSSVLERDDPPGIKVSLAIVVSGCNAAFHALKPNHLVHGTDKIPTITFLDRLNSLIEKLKSLSSAIS